MLMFCAVICNAQNKPGIPFVNLSGSAPGIKQESFNAGVIDAPQPSIKIKVALGNGEYIVEINGVEQRTISAEHARDIAQRKIDLDAANRTVELLTGERDSLKRVIELTARKAELDAREIALLQLERNSYRSMFDAEHSLRLQSEKLQGGVTGFFNNPFVQILTKAAIPAVNTWLSSRQKK